MQTMPINFRVTQEDIQILDERAQAAGLSRGEYVRRQALGYPIEESLQKQIEALAVRVNLPPSEVLTGILCDFLAELVVSTEKGRPRTFPEFQTPRLSPMELLEVLIEGKRIKRRQAERNAARQREMLGGTPSSDVGDTEGD